MPEVSFTGNRSHQPTKMYYLVIQMPHYHPMIRALIPGFYLAVAVCFFSCNNTSSPRNNIVCIDSSYHEIKIDNLKGYQVRTDVDLRLLENFYLFDDVQQLKKVFTTSTDTPQTPIDFTKNFVAACVIDNKVGALVNGNPTLTSSPLLLHIDTCYIKNCRLQIPFFIKRMNTDTIPMEHLAQRYLRKFFLFQVPRKLGLTYMFFDNTGGGTSYKMKLPADNK